MKKAFLFPGQGSQFPGMGKDLFERFEQVRPLFQEADDILGFKISQIMFEGTADELKRTDVTQPAVFIHSMAVVKAVPHFDADMVAGHSLGEFSALVAAGVLSFQDALRLVSTRARAMQEACMANPGTMAAVIGADDALVEMVCSNISNDVVVAANYNCPGQLVISGSRTGIDTAIAALREAGVKRALPLPVGGAFHSPLMEPAREALEAAIMGTTFNAPSCPIYQNVNAKATTEVDAIRRNLIAQLTAPVRWTQTITNMVADGATTFIECGPGNVLQGLAKKIAPEAEIKAAELPA